MQARNLERDPEEPRLEGGASLEAPEAPVYDQEHVLNGVIHLSLWNAEAAQAPPHEVEMSLVQGVERGPVRDGTDGRARRPERSGALVSGRHRHPGTMSPAPAQSVTRT